MPEEARGGAPPARSRPGPLLRAATAARRRLTRRRIGKEARRAFPGWDPAAVGSTRRLDVLPLYEADALDGLARGAGASFLIRTDRASILFDLGLNPSGQSPSPLESNMDRLGVARSGIDALVISHRHPDHVGGLPWWAERSFSFTGGSRPPLGGLTVYASDRLTYPGIRVRRVRGPLRLAEGVATTGPFAFFEPYKSWSVRPNYSEQALAVQVEGRGLVLITGCGHMGLAALLDRAARLFAVPVIGVIGGLHYVRAEEAALRGDIERLRRLDPALVALSAHDSGPAALAAFARAFPAAFRPIRAGESLTLG